MTTTPPLDPSDALPIPDDAIVLPSTALSEPGDEWEPRMRRLALAALRQAMRERQCDLPLGPEQSPEEPSRLLVLNRFTVQLVVGGFTSDEFVVPLVSWRQEAAAPQLVLAAAIEEEDGVVIFPGVLTGAEFRSRCSNAPGRFSTAEATETVVDREAFRGGVDRLLTLVQLLDPAAIPRTALAPSTSSSVLVRVVDWLRGQLDDALVELGAELVPSAAAGFRSDALLSPPPQAPQTLSIPLGIDAKDRLVSGDAARVAVERFRLLLSPLGEGEPTGLLLRLLPELQGDLLPDGLELRVRHGTRQHRLTTAASTAEELTLAGDAAPIEVALHYGASAPLQLPPLLLGERQ